MWLPQVFSHQFMAQADVAPFIPADAPQRPVLPLLLSPITLYRVADCGFSQLQVSALTLPKPSSSTGRNPHVETQATTRDPPSTTHPPKKHPAATRARVHLLPPSTPKNWPWERPRSKAHVLQRQPHTLNRRPGSPDTPTAL